MIRTMIQRFREDETVVCECRNCGTTVEDPDSVCPNCGMDEIARYQIPPRPS